MKSLLSLFFITSLLVGCAGDTPEPEAEPSAVMKAVQADLERDRQRRDSKIVSERVAARKVAYQAVSAKLAEADRNAEIQRQATAKRSKQIAELERKTRLENEARAKKKRDADKPSTDQVLYAGRKFVKASLKSPSTADFGGWFGNGTGLDHGGGIYTAKMWVDSQNSFGATIRTQCWVKMRHKSGSNFDLIQLSTD
ncbi:MAG: cell envelope integrity protein TolA, partial [Mariniblastus sp.]